MSKAIQHSLEGLLGEVEITLSAEIGHLEIPVHALLNLKEGSVIPVGKRAKDPLDLFVSGSLLARGEMVIINDHFGIRISEMIASEAIIPASFQSEEKGL